MSLFYYYFRTGFNSEKARYRQERENVRKHFSQKEIKKASFVEQHGQDFFVANYFKNKKKGVFVDIGANDGICFSNSYALEKKYNWSGLCIEPLPKEFKNLKKIRKCKLEQVCIGAKKKKVKFLVHAMLSGVFDAYEKKHLERIGREEKAGEKKKFITVQMVPLSDLLKKHKIKKVDFLSIDVEGGEKSVLESINL